MTQQARRKKIARKYKNQAFVPLPHTQNLREVRPGVVRKVVEWPTSLWARLIIAGRTRNISTSVMLRAIVGDWLQKHSIVPDYTAPPVEVSVEAFDVARSMTGASARADAMFGPSSAIEIARIFAGVDPEHARNEARLAESGVHHSDEGAPAQVALKP